MDDPHYRAMSLKAILISDEIGDVSFVTLSCKLAAPLHWKHRMFHAERIAERVIPPQGFSKTPAARLAMENAMIRNAILFATALAAGSVGAAFAQGSDAPCDATAVATGTCEHMDEMQARVGGAVEPLDNPGAGVSADSAAGAAGTDAAGTDTGGDMIDSGSGNFSATTGPESLTPSAGSLDPSGALPPAGQPGRGSGTPSGLNNTTPGATPTGGIGGGSLGGG